MMLIRAADINERTSRYTRPAKGIHRIQKLIRVADR
jgi:hypothetical protein